MKLESPEPITRSVDFAPQAPREDALAAGAVVSFCSVASAIGARVLRQGGNAADAAVAVALALGVSYPQAASLGGGGFLLYADADGTQHFLDYRESAPRGIRAHHLRSSDGRRTSRSVFGAMSVAVPGTVAGLAELLRRFGTWSWEKASVPAAEMAEAGVWLTQRQAQLFARYRPDLERFASTRRTFGLDRADLAPGTPLRQPELARTLRLLAEHGPEDFYRGRVARQIAAEVRRNEGVLDEEDLRAYRAVWRAPLCIPFAGREIYTANLPSGGAVVLALSLGLLDRLGVEDTAPGSKERCVMLARAFRMAFALRLELAGDPDHLGERERNRLAALLDTGLSVGDLERFEARYLAEKPRAAGPLSTCTTHFCVIDSARRVVSNTFSLNTLFGCKMSVGGAGFLLNNTLDDFRIGGSPNWYGLPDGPANELAPLRRPVGSMAPTIVMGPQRQVEIVIGGSGGPLIPTAVAQTLLGLLVDARPLWEAMGAPRLHHQFVRAETQVERGISPQAAEALAGIGDPAVPNRRNAILTAIHRDPATGGVETALDRRLSPT